MKQVLKNSVKILFQVGIMLLIMIGAVQPLSVSAAPLLTLTPITWNVVGLDSNSPTTGPHIFPVGVRVCNTGTAATNVQANFQWEDSTNSSYIYLRSTPLPGSSSSITLPTLAAGTVGSPTCSDFYFEVDINQVSASYDKARRYYITVTADGGISLSTPRPREIYVEHLVSQSRNSSDTISLDGTPIPPGGTMALVVGQTYNIQLSGSTSTNGYEQLESYINFPNTIFKVNLVTTTYSANGGTDSLAGTKLYADGCGWVNDPNSPLYRSCTGTGKYGGTVTNTYNVTILSGGGTNSPLYHLLYDFSGSSYHYNAGYPVTMRIAAIIDPASATISKSFTPSTTTVNGVSTLSFTLTNPNGAQLTGVNFADTFPANMKVATPAVYSTSGCGTPTFTPVGGTDSISFSNGTISANGTCVVNVSVTTAATGSYDNTSGNLYIGTVNTGDNASANLTVNDEPAPPACTPGLELARWEFNGTTLTPTYQSPRVTNATATYVGSGTSSVSTTIGNPVNSWGVTSGWAANNTGYPNNGAAPYFQFLVDTSKYSSVAISYQFKVDGNWASAGNNYIYTYSNADGSAFSTRQTTNGFSKNDPFATITATALQTGTSTTAFRINAVGQQQTTAVVYLDNIVITGCGVPVPPTITKTFATNPVAVGGTSSLTFTLTNSNSIAATGVAFTDTLPTGLTVGNTSTTTCGGTLTTTSPSTISFTGGTVSAKSSCTTSGITVTAATAGPHQNISGNVSSTQGGTNNGAGGTASASLTAILPPHIEKLFSPNSIPVGGTSTLQFNITNPNADYNLTGVGFIDTYPTNVVNQTPNGYTNTCGGMITAADGGGSIQLSGGTVPAAGNCTVTVNVSSTVAGAYANSSGTVSATTAGAGNSDSDTLTVTPVHPAISILKQVSNSVTGPWSTFVSVNPPLPKDVFFRFTVENTGDVALTNVAVVDPGVNLSDCVTTLAGGLALYETKTCVSGAVSVTTTGSYSNTAYATGDTATSNDSTARYATTGLTLDKTATETLLPAAGQLIHYSYLVTNSGYASLLGPVTVTDDKTTVSCPAVSTVGDSDDYLDQDESLTCTATYTVTAGDVSTGYVTNHATASAGGISSNQDTVTVGANNGMIIVDKVTDPTGDPQSFAFTTIGTGYSGFSLADATTPNSQSLAAGTYSVAETAVTGWRLDSATCVSSIGDTETAVSIELDSGETVTCTFTNTRMVPAVTLTKSATPTSLLETGGSVTFTFLVENNGNDVLTVDSLIDDVFGDLNSQGTCITPQTIAVAGSYSCTYTTTLASDTLTSHHDTATVNVTGAYGGTTSDTGDATVTFTDVLPDISVTKTANPASVPETGGSVTFTYTVINNSAESAEITSLVDDQFGTLAGDADCQVGTALAGSASCSFDATFSVPAGDYPGSHVNRFTAAVKDNENNTDSAYVDRTVTYTDVLPDISVTKTAGTSSVPETGGSVTFTYNVTNNSAEAATITVLDDDQFGTLSGDTDCQVGTVLAGSASCSFDATFAIPAGDYPGSHVDVFSATVTDGDGNTDTATESETVTYTDVLPDIAVTKTSGTLSVPETGSDVTFTFIVTNNSAEAATITALSDDQFGTLAGDGDCQVGTVIAGSGSCTFDATFTVPAADYPGSHINTFSATVTDGDGNTDSASDSETVTYTDVLPDISVTKTAGTLSVPETGGDVTFTYVVTNHSTESATIIALSDDKFGALAGDPTCQVGTVLADGANCSFEATFTIPAGDYPGSHVDVFTATVTDGDGNDDTATDGETITYTDVLPDITVTKTSNPTSVLETGGNVTFTYVVTNHSLEPAEITVLSDDQFGALVGDADCAVGTVLVGGTSCDFAATFAVPMGDVPGSHVNTFSATVTDGDGNTDTATDSETISYTDVLPDISVTKTGTPTSAPETGDDVTFTYTVTNNAAESAEITALDDDQFGPLTGDADCAIGMVLGSGTSCSFDATFTVPAGDFPGSHVNVFSATVTDGDGNTDTATESETVTYTDVLPDISVTKTAGTSSVPETGGNVTFTYTVTNNSSESATITVLSDDQFGALPGDADCNVGTVLAGSASCSFDATFTIPAGVYPGSHVNIFTATVNDGDGNTDTATESETVTYTDVLPDISVTKTGAPTSVPETGGSVTFTYTVLNDSPESAAITVLDDDQFGALAGDADCAVGTVLAGSADCSFDATFSIPAGDYPGSHVNVFSATVNDGDGNTDTATDNETVSYTDVLPDISVTKTAGASSVPETGGNVMFTYTVTNNSAEAATITSLSDDQFGTLAGDADCQAGTVLASGASCSFDATFAVPAGNVPGSHVDLFTAVASDGDGNTDTATDNATVTYTDVLPAITVGKSANPTSVPEVGGAVTFTYTVTNDSTETATITVLSDDQFGTLTGDSDCQVGTVLAGSASCSFDATFTVPAGDYPGSHVDQFSATVTDGDGNNANDTATATVSYDPGISLVLTKTGVLDITVVTPDDEVNVGDTITYGFSVENTGDVPLGVTVSDPLLPGLTCTISSLAAGATDTCTATGNVYTLTQTDLDKGKVDNTATANGYYGSAPTSDTDDETIPLTVNPDFVITKTGILDMSVVDPANTANAGDQVTYSFSVENTGNVTLGTVTITDPLLPGLSCTVDAPLEVGEADSCTATGNIYTLVAADITAGYVENTATGTTTYGGETLERSDVETKYFSPRLTLVKSAEETRFRRVGDELHYNYVLTNAGNVTLYPPYVVTDDKVAVTCPDTPGQLEQGESVTCTATYTVTQADVDAKVVTNNAQAFAQTDGEVLISSNRELLRVRKPTNTGGETGGEMGVLGEGAFLPATGFAPNVVTPLDVSKAVQYDDTEMILEIPSIGVRTSITGVPLATNEWNLDWLSTNVGWLEGTAYPTHPGNSAITAHVYLPSGMPGPFVQLSTMKWGQQIIVNMGGQKYIYSVREVKRVTPDDLSVLKHEEYSWLTLLTCQSYDEQTGNYRYRVAVRAVLVDVK